MSAEVQAAKARLLELETQRKAIEQQIEECTGRLTAPGGAGLTGSLVDKEGFPRSDVDVVQARKDRHAIACLSNDHKDISRKLALLLDEYHELLRKHKLTNASKEQSEAATSSAAAAPASTSAQAAGTGKPSPSQATEAAVASEPGAPASVLLVPFAVIDDISEDSPASTAGMQVGDQLCRFGDVSAGGEGVLQRVAAVLQRSEGIEVEAVVLRHGAPTTLQLTPRKWSGRGLLGCHLRPL